MGGVGQKMTSDDMVTLGVEGAGHSGRTLHYRLRLIESVH